MSGLVAAAALVAGSLSAAPLDDVPEPPGDVRALIQSELDYLEGAGRLVTLELDEVAPRIALERIGKAGGLSVIVRGHPPVGPKLSGSFSEQPIKAVLEWFAQRVPVSYKAEGQDRLVVVFVEPAR